MRFSSYALPVLAANLVAALPAPQDIDLDMVIAAPDPTSYSEAVGVTAQTITVDIAAAAAQATAALSSVSVDAGDVLSSTAIVQAKRAAATCVPQPTGAVSASSPDTPDGFKADSRWSAAALDPAAAAPGGYVQTFSNKQASNNAFIYMGFDTFQTYDVASCASRCTSKLGCVSFNMYFERDPSVNPNDASCSDPSSQVMIKCAYWGGPISAANANNFGQTRGSFSVLIAGSNGYVSTSVSTPAGFNDAVSYGDKAMNAPYDAQGYNTFMGSKIFTQSSFNTTLCSEYCNAQTAYNKATAPKDGTPYKVCNYFNTYMLFLNPGGSSAKQVAQGQYCSLYTEPWTNKYATNGGQMRGTDQYVVSYSFGFSKPNAGLDPLVGDANGATYQAVADIKWSKLQPFCSAYLGYSIPVSTVTSVATTVPVVTSTSYSTTTVSPNKVRRALSIPADLSKYPATVISSACSMQASKPSSTSVTTAFSTVTAAASTTVISVVSTTTAAVDPTSTSFNLVNSSGSYIGTETTASDGTETSASDRIFAYSGATKGSVFTLNYQTGELSVAYGGSQWTLLSAVWQDNVFPLAKFSTGSGKKANCLFSDSQGLVCDGDNYFSACPNDNDVHFANYVPNGSKCTRNVLVAVSVA
ncbi:hypothetical protein E4T38_08152 [Aureobasidium subglaciale]|nr:hypothetical protein E4T38_08152 [Aureobasidium subglaciale]KAI5215858.1 hypothetical protein E4T40_08162 [Aureobasidium subglaciale]KAI5219191.1 hypothetical protein E4T41_08028 [Aureobasidium subglaciale]KAI5256644.1 hypothetical protein E4T46_08053 [Aureobasidium subglaciale]